MSGYAVLIAPGEAERVLDALPKLGWRLTDAAGRISGIDGEGEVRVLTSPEQARPFLDAGGLLIWHGVADAADGAGPAGPAGAAHLGVAFHWRQPGALKLQLDGLQHSQRKQLLAGLERLLIGHGPVGD